MKQKRGQVTYFIVLGFLILLIVGVLLYYKEDSVMDDTPDFEIPTAPVERNIYECYYQTAKSGLMLMGLQGGYMDMFTHDFNNNLDSYLNLDKSGFIRVSQWVYDNEIHVPTIEQQEEALSRYVEENVDGCIDNIGFINGFKITRRSNISVETVIHRQYVEVKVDYPMNIYLDEDQSVVRLDGMDVGLEVAYGKLMELAEKSLFYENATMFIEDIVVDHMAMHPDIPFTGMEFSCDPKMWTIGEVRENVAELIYIVTSKIQFLNTEHLELQAEQKVYEDIASYSVDDIINGNYPKNVPEDAFDYFQYYRNTTGEDYDNFSMSLIYRPEWDFYLYARPNSNGILRSNMGESYSKLLGFLCMNVYHFTYDLNFPVMFTLKDDLAFDGEGFTLRFAMPVFIDHNKGNRNFKTSFFVDGAEYNEDFCLNNPDKEVYITATGLEQGIYGLDLDDVNISYTCIKYKCPLGTTHGTPKGYGLQAMLPSNCAYGYLTAQKEGYIDKTVQLTSYDEDVVIDMDRLHNLSFRVVKHPSNSPDATYAVGEHEFVSVYLKNKEKSHSVYAMFNSSTENYIELIDDDSVYDINVLIFDIADDAFRAGYMANWTYSAADIVGAQEIVFHAIEKVPVAITEQEQLDFMGSLDDYSTNHSAQLQPTFT